MNLFCPRCGARLPGPPPCRCTSCRYALYVNPKPSGGVVILDGPRFLAVKRAREPQAGLWDLPGGFCEPWEHPADAAVREAREELGVRVRLGPFIGMYVGSYDFQGEKLPVLDCFYAALIESGSVVLDPAEASSYAWLPVDAPPPFAFATMDAALRDLNAALRDSNVMFQDFFDGTSAGWANPIV